MNFSKYEKYKYSGVQWLGEIPEQWEIKRLKDVGKVVLGKMLKTNEEDGYQLKEYLKSKNIGWLNVNLEQVESMYFNKYELDIYRIKENDLLLSEGGEVGKTCIWRNELDECYIQNSVHKVTINKFNSPFFYLYYSFIIGSLGVYDAVVNQVSIKHLTREKLIIIPVVAPPLSEQIRIGEYLNEKTAQIDKNIELLQDKKEKYQELRKTIINKTLTKGVDKTVELKDSNIDWLGKIPKHWEVKRVKDLFNLITDIAPNDNDCQLLSIYTSIGVKPRAELEQRGNKAVTTDGYWIVKKGDFIVNKLLAWMGAIALSDYDGVTSPAYDILRKKIPLVQKYYEYLFRTEAAQAEFKRNSRGIMEVRLRLYFDKFGAISVPAQSLEEQQQIVDYLDEKTQKIDAIIAKIDEKIVALNEFRKTLINDAITGKIKVV
jgi:type I restriction enzyme S subunit